MKILGIDYGTKRIGLAMSDDGGTIAFPKGIIKNDSTVLKYIEKLIKDENIEEIVIGESLDLDGTQNKVNEKIQSFAKELESMFKIKVSFQKEFMTSVEARKTTIFKSSLNQTQASSRVKKETGEKVDAKAAALILQRYLDKKNK
ncbi:MAG: Holliday junction resolvase RuvX [Patescibacteria group bacterium]